jgi:hypothetical protein
MKTYLECLSEAAALIGKPHISAAIKLELSDDELALLQEAADMYAEQSNSHKPVVVRGGDSENQFVQHVGKYFDYKNVNTTPNTPTEPLPAEGLAKSVCGGVMQTCDKCGKTFQWPVTSLKCDECA